MDSILALSPNSNSGSIKERDKERKKGKERREGRKKEKKSVFKDIIKLK